MFNFGRAIEKHGRAKSKKFRATRDYFFLALPSFKTDLRPWPVGLLIAQQWAYRPSIRTIRLPPSTIIYADQQLYYLNA